MDGKSTLELGEHLLAQVHALLKAARRGETHYHAGLAVKEVKPSPAAFWAFIRRIAPD